MKKAIAMKCTQGQWDSIKGRIPEGIKIFMLGKFNKKTYIVLFEDKSITNASTFDRSSTDEIHETFNAKIFLEACGIEVEEKYEITKEQILELSNNFGNDNKSGLRSNLTSKLEQWFPDAFKKDFTGWAKNTLQCNEKWIVYFENDIFQYGIGADGKWFDSKNGVHIFKFSDQKNNREATTQEVESALICEWERRGGKKGVIFNTPKNSFQSIDNGTYYFIKPDNCLYSNGFAIFNSGKWATIIETITKEEAEKILNKKIV